MLGQCEIFGFLFLNLTFLCIIVYLSYSTRYSRCSSEKNIGVQINILKRTSSSAATQRKSYKYSMYELT